MNNNTEGIDSVSLDIPLLIRLLEYAREDAKTDMDLHKVTEKLIAMSQRGGVLSMNDYDTIVSKISEAFKMPKPTAAERLYQHHQNIRKKSGLPDPDYYKELLTTYELPNTERWARVAEIKKKYGIEENTITNEHVNTYVEELSMAGYEIITESKVQCPECGGALYSDKILAEKKDACYSKVRSRYNIWPSAYASGALVKCRKVGAKNWGNKSKKKVNESSERYIVYFNNKPVAHYPTEYDARQNIRSVIEKLPDTKVEIKKEVCDIKPVELNENLRKWFKEKWVRFNPQGKIMGDCARGSSKEGKPKCLPLAKARAMDKKSLASSAAKKRREDPNPERKGQAKLVATKTRSMKEDDSIPTITSPEDQKEPSNLKKGLDVLGTIFTANKLLKDPKSLADQEIKNYIDPSRQNQSLIRRIFKDKDQ